MRSSTVSASASGFGTNAVRRRPRPGRAARIRVRQRLQILADGGELLVLLARAEAWEAVQLAGGRDHDLAFEAETGGGRAV